MNLLKKLQNAITRATVKLVNSATKTQSLQIGLVAGEIKGGIEHMEPYGFTSHPHVGAEGIAVFFGGDRSNGVVIVAADKRYRLLNLADGEVALYDDQGQQIVFKRAGIVVKTPKTLDAECGGDVTVTAPNVNIIGNVSVTGRMSVSGDVQSSGSIQAAGDVKAGSISLNSHTHTGVQPGSSNTGAPQ